MNSMLIKLALLPAAIAGLAYRSLIAHVMWGWFVTATMGIVSPGMAAIMGFALGCNILFAKYNHDTRTDKEIVLSVLFASPIASTVAFGTGWALSCFV